jgi:hypothetical protein
MTTLPFELGMGLLPLSSFAPYAPYALLTPPPAQRWLDTLYNAQAWAPMLANPMSLPHTPYRRPFDTSPNHVALASPNAAVAFPPDLLTMLAGVSTVMSAVLNVAAQQELMLFHRWLAVQQALIFGAAAAKETADRKSSPTDARTTAKRQ